MRPICRETLKFAHEVRVLPLASKWERSHAGQGSTHIVGSDMGPMIDKANVERVNQMVEDALAAGAKAIVRGGPVTEGPLGRGAFYRPTLLEVTDSRLLIVQEEVFGPVVTMQIQTGLKELDAGRGVPHKDVANWLRSWGRKQERKAPRG